MYSDFLLFYHKKEKEQRIVLTDCLKSYSKNRGDYDKMVTKLVKRYKT